MGCRDPKDKEERSAESRTNKWVVNDALVLTTMCLIGLSVDVHIIDGSVYSGIFHTASLDHHHHHYAIVLKRAKMTKKGRCNSNVANKDVIETLVIQSDDLVQIVAKKVVIPADVFAGHEAGDDAAAVASSVPSNGISFAESNKTTSKSNAGGQPHANQSRKNGGHTSSSEQLVTSSAPSETVTAKIPKSNPTVKEFKLNPGAKTFSPSFPNKKSPTPPTIATGANLAYIPDSYPGGSVVRPQPEVEISPFASHTPPVKYVPYGGNGVQHLPPIAGYMTNRSQPVRYGVPYHPVQTAPTYVQPSSQNAMVGRLGPVVYVHPVSQVPSTNSFSSILTPHQVHVPKHQGTVAAQALQLLHAAPPLMGGGQPPFVLPSHIPVSHPTYPVMRPISVPGSNGFLVSKFS
ncbi:putative ataxin 2, SM domain-containing protein [Helianthus anomalus]